MSGLVFDPKDPIALTEALIRCASVTPEEAGALALIESALRPAGFTVERPRFEEAGTPPVENLYARIGEGGPALVFAGHVDVVPPGDAARWTNPPFDPMRRDGRLYGRGAADMKGGVAASISAALRQVAAHGAPKNGSIAFLITGDEEGPAINGTVKLLDWAKARGERFDHCVLGEPTSKAALGDMMKIGRRGSLTCRLTVTGRQGHIAYPALHENPIPGMARLISALSDTPLDDGTEHFDPSTLGFTTVDVGNSATNVVPGAVRATFNVRFNTRWTGASLEAELRARLDRAAAGRLRYTLTVERGGSNAFLTEPGAFVTLVADAIRQETGLTPVLSTSGGTSDARFIKAHAEVIEFGAVGESMHQVDEFVRLDDLTGLTSIYQRIIERYFARG